MSRVLEGKNRASASEAGSFVDRYEELEAQVATKRSEFMLACKKIREEQKELLDDAKSQGVAKKIVKAIAEARKLEAKAKAKLDDLEDDDRTFAVDIRKALGDFADSPLGQAAVAANGQDETTAAIVAATDKAWTDTDSAKKRKGAAAAAH